MAGVAPFFRTVRRLRQQGLGLTDDGTDVVERLDVRDAEPHAEFHLDATAMKLTYVNESQSVDVVTPSFHSQNDRVVRQEIAENAGEVLSECLDPSCYVDLRLMWVSGRRIVNQRQNPAAGAFGGERFRRTHEA